MRKNRAFFFISLFLFFPVFLNGVNQPNHPKTPAVSQENKEKPKSLTGIQAEITFYGKDTSFKGRMSIPSFKLIIVSEKQGFQFYKEMGLSEIKTIRIKKWKGVAFKNSKDGRHNFYPIEYEIEDHRGVSFLYLKNIPELNEFIFETEYGTTKVFSYYVDYLKGSYWEMTRRKSSDLETNKALNKVVSEIEIEKISIEDQKKEK